VLYEVLRKGSAKRLVWAADNSGKFRGRAYFENLDMREQAKFEPAFAQIAETGEYRNPEKFRYERDGISVFKIHKHRLSCFLDEGGDVVILHGFGKKATRAKREARELDKAVSLKVEYLERKKRES
jgi:hypothetical protein